MDKSKPVPTFKFKIYTKNMKICTLLLLSLGLLFSCNSSVNDLEADTIIYNGHIYTLDDEKEYVSAVAVKEGVIIATGTDEDMMAYATDNTALQNLDQAFAMPGFIEGHGHFSGLGYSLIDLNFLTIKSWDEIVSMVEAAAQNAEPGEWIIGRGWHQEKWTSTPEPSILGYPFHYDLSEVSPDNPVMLRHASGHSLFANEKAMEEAGVTVETPNPSGGEIVRDASGAAIGVFEERAMKIISQAYKDYEDQLSTEQVDAKWYKAVELASQECLQKGITSFQDAGSLYFEVDRYKALAQAEQLDIRLWGMLRHSYEVMKDSLDDFPIIDEGNRFFTCRAIKSEVDGALGAFGAWLLKSYADKSDFAGQNTTPISEVKNIATLAYENDMQMCVHAIGDRANRIVLNIYEEFLKPRVGEKDLRWRIEHAQHLDTLDIPRFKALEVIASMQGIHCTSDAPFVEKRLGRERSRLGAYPWRSLLDAGVTIANGTDAPVEDVDPIACFYASVTRKRADNGFEFFPEQRMTRAEAVYSYTLGNAYAAFEDTFKGSLEEGKVADMVVLSNNLLECSDEEVLETEVLMTILDGEVVYKR